MTNTEALIIPPIEESICKDSVENYESVEERYYQQFYWCPGKRRQTDCQEQKEDHLLNQIKSCDKDLIVNGDQVVLVHSNRVCLVGLAPSHPIIRDRLEIKRLDFDFGDPTLGRNRLDNKVSGKGKKGGQGIDERSVLCYIECQNKDGETVRYPVRSLMKGKLIEINEQVVKNPKLILDAPSTEGHIAVILPKIPDGLAEVKSRLINKEEYLTYIQQKLSGCE